MPQFVLFRDFPHTKRQILRRTKYELNIFAKENNIIKQNYMKKKSVITMLVIMALGMPLVASGQRQETERRPKKEMRVEIQPKAMHPKAMHHKDFKMMCEVVEDASFPDKMIGVIKVACISSYFTSKQCAELLSIFSFEKDKLQALKVLRPKMLDLNPKEIQKQFTFSSGKEEAMEIMYPER